MHRLEYVVFCDTVLRTRLPLIFIYFPPALYARYAPKNPNHAVINERTVPIRFQRLPDHIIAAKPPCLAPHLSYL